MDTFIRKIKVFFENTDIIKPLTEAFKSTNSRDTVLIETLPKSSLLFKSACYTVVMVTAIAVSLAPDTYKLPYASHWIRKTQWLSFGKCLLVCGSHYRWARAQWFVRLPAADNGDGRWAGSRVWAAKTVNSWTETTQLSQGQPATGDPGSRLAHTMQINCGGDQEGRSVGFKVWKGGRHTWCNVWNAQCFHSSHSKYDVRERNCMSPPRALWC